mgnify:CR=1 FL=1
MTLRRDSQGTAETREDRFWRLLDEKLDEWENSLWMDHRDGKAALVEGFRKRFREAREESKEGQ